MGAAYAFPAVAGLSFWGRGVCGVRIMSAPRVPSSRVLPLADAGACPRVGGRVPPTVGATGVVGAGGVAEAVVDDCTTGVVGADASFLVGTVRRGPPSRVLPPAAVGVCSRVGGRTPPAVGATGAAGAGAATDGAAKAVADDCTTGVVGAADSFLAGTVRRGPPLRGGGGTRPVCGAVGADGDVTVAFPVVRFCAPPRVGLVFAPTAACGCLAGTEARTT